VEMIKKLLIILVILCLPAMGFAEIFCLNNGDNWNGTDCGTDCSAEVSANTCMDEGDFNTTANWAATDTDDNKIGPGDTVYLSGAISTALVPKGSGTSGKQITIDGWEGGSCAPRSATCSSSATSTVIWDIDKDYISIVDMRFNRNGYNVRVGENAKASFIKIERNAFTQTGDVSGSSLEMRYMCDSLVNDNTFSASEVAYEGNNFTLGGGSRNTITYNNFFGGTVAVYLKSTTQFYYSNTDATNDPDFNISYNEIAYNNVEASAQEGISFDVSAGGYSGLREWDTVSNVSDNVVTLSHASWSSATAGQYVGFYMVAIEDANDVFGQHALITGHTNAVFTLDGAITNLEVGDHVSIQLVYKRNWIHHNTLADIGFSPSGILIDGGGLENLIENNTFDDNDGIKIQSLSAFNQATAFNDITGTCGVGAAAFNVVRDNNAEEVRMYHYEKPASCAVSKYTSFNTRNNAVYDNTLVVGAQSTLSYTYFDSNILGIEQDDEDCANDDPSCDEAVDATAGLTGWPFTASPNPPEITVVTTDDIARESNTGLGQWTLYCNPTCGDAPGIDVTYALSGTATGGTTAGGCVAGIDYTLTSLTTINVTGTYQVVNMTACDDAVVEDYEEIATLTVTDEAAYDVGTANTDNISVFSDDESMPIYDYGSTGWR